MPELTLADLAQASELVVDRLRPLTTLDWTTPAPGLRWDARRVAEHVVGVAFGYAMALARHPQSAAPRLRRHDPTQTPSDLVELLDAGTRLLVLASAAIPDGATLHHPTGTSDRSGYLAMSCDEILVHGNDIATAVGEGLEVPDELAEKVVARLFPWAPRDQGGWETLLWANGRASLGDRPPADARWRWHAEPLSQWDGVTIPLWPERA